MKPRAVTALLLVWLVLAVSSQALAQAVGAWASRAPMPVALALPTNVGVVKGLLYTVGGANFGGLVDTVSAYDLRTNSWTSKASLPTRNAAPGVGVVGGILYAVGGYTAPDPTFSSIARVFAYDPATNVWTEVAPMSAARWAPGVAVVKGILYAIGGAAGGGTPLQSVEAYDPRTNTWTPKASMPTPRLLFGLGQVDGIIYVAGGQNAGNLATVEAYDPKTNTWTSVASMPAARTRLAAGVLNGRLYAVGGDSLGTVEAYDPATNTWETALSMPTPRDTLGAGVVKGVLHAVGGFSLGSFLATNEAYCPPAPHPTAPAASGRCQAQLVLYDDFSAGLIDPDKWWGSNTDLGAANPTIEALRLVKGRQLELRLNQYGLNNSDSGSSQGAIRLFVTNPTPITTWQATVTVVSAEVETCSTNPGVGVANIRAGAEIYGRFFNDGSSTGPGDQTGDMTTGIQMDRHGTLGDVFSAVLARCANSSCSSFQFFRPVNGLFTTPWVPQKRYTLTLTWDAANHQFIYSVKPDNGSTETITFPYTQSDSTPPVFGFRVLEVQNAAVNCNGSQKHAFMDALFDNVMVNQ